MRWLRIAWLATLRRRPARGGVHSRARPAPPRILLVNPSSIEAGFAVELRATCGDNVNPAFVHSTAFGSVTLVPDNGVLTRNVTVPQQHQVRHVHRESVLRQRPAEHRRS